MFDVIRKAIKESILIKILMGLMIISFGVFGVGDFIGTGGMDPNIALKAGDREVNVVEFQSRYDREYANFKESVGGQMPDTEMVRRSVMDAMVQEMTRAATMDAAAEKLGVVVTDEQLRAAVRNMDAFKDPSGSFSQITYGEVLQQNGLTESTFLDLMRTDIRQRVMLQPLALGSQAPQYLIDSLFTYRGEGRVADTLLVRSSAIVLAEKATDAELKSLYDQSTAVFMRPEYRKVSVIALRASELVRPETFAEDELKSYYDSNAARYRTPETRRVAQLVFDTQEEAEKVRALAVPGDTLAALAAKAKLAAPIDLGEQARESVVGKSMGAAYDLGVNEISPATRTDLGWHIFSVTAIVPEHVTPYEEAKDAIRRALAEDKGLDAVYRASTDVQDALAAGTPMAEIANTLGISLTEIAAIDQAGRDMNGAEVPGLIDRNTLLSTLFGLPENGDTGLRDLPERDGYYVAKVESIAPPSPKPFEEVRGELTAMWQRDNVMTEARKIADGLAAEIGASTALPGLATKDGKVAFAEVGPVTRFGQSADPLRAVDSGRLSAAMLQKLFAAKPGETFTADVGEGVVVARLKEIVKPEAAGAFATERNQLTATLRNAVTADLLEQMHAAFAAQYPSEVNQAVIDRMVQTAR